MYNDKIFVFGSNLAGRHGKGAARFAKQFLGAIENQGVGLQGGSYAIPTKDGQLNVLSLDIISKHINNFIDFANTNPQLTFMISRIGCGLAGYKDEEIINLFLNSFNTKGQPTNIILPYTWQVQLNNNAPLNKRIIIAGGREFNDYVLLKAKMDRILSNFDPKTVTIVSGGARGADSLGEQYAKENQLELDIFPADWDTYKKVAGPIRNQYMSWYSNYLVAFWDGGSTGTKHMIDTATEDKLQVRVVNYQSNIKPSRKI